MKKDIKNLTQEIFKDRELLNYIGFSQKEAEIFYDLIQGKSINAIAENLGVSPYQIRKLKKQKFHLIPIFMRRKMTLVWEFPLTEIYEQLSNLDELISDSVETLRKFYLTPLNELPISTRTFNALVAGGIKDTDQLCAQTAEDLLRFRSIGKKAIKEISTALEQYGLSLKE